MLHASARRPLLILLGVSCVLGLITLARLDTFGIWDPSELGAADAARKLNETGGRPAGLAQGLVALGFQTLGIHEWAGRLPIALAGVLLLLVVWSWVGGLAGKRVGAHAMLILGTTPFFLFHSRLMLGAAPVFLVGALVMLGASMAVFGPLGEFPERDSRKRIAWLGLALAAGVLGVGFSGALLTAAPALLAVFSTWLALGSDHRAYCSPTQRLCGWLSSVAGLALLWLIGRDVLAHAADAGPWVGAVAVDPEPPSYEHALARIFHAFVPWSCLLPVALGTLLRSRETDSPRAALKLLVLSWAVWSYAAQTLFESAYGEAPFVGGPALAAAVALWIDDKNEATSSTRWTERLILLLMVGLALRDFALYPASPLEGFALGDEKLPAVFNPKRSWAVLLGVFGISALALHASPKALSASLRAPYSGLARLFRTSFVHKLWLSAAAVGLLALLGVGGTAWLRPTVLPLNSLGVRIWRGLFFVPFVLPVAVAAAQWIAARTHRLARFHALPSMCAAVAIGAYSSHGFTNELSAHLSPRDVFDTFNRLAQPGEKLAQFKVEGRAGAYYARGSVAEVSSRGELLEFLGQPGRRWAALPSGELADIDDTFRKQRGTHLFVPAADNARVTLVASQPIRGVKDQNPLSRFVLREVPRLQHPVKASFGDEIELLGYDLSLPAKDHVGPGQSFTITWAFRAKQGALGNYKVFVHVDGQEQRLHGDHDPVDGKYPVRLWDEGDVIVDQQTLQVPSTYPEGRYTLYVGFFRGDTRLEVTAGQEDDANRVIAGTIEVQ